MRRVAFTIFLVVVLGLPGLDAFACLVNGSCGCHESTDDHDAAAEAPAKKPCCPEMQKAVAAAEAREAAARDTSRTGLQSEHHACCCEMGQPDGPLQAQNDFRIELDSQRELQPATPPSASTPSTPRPVTNVARRRPPPTRPPDIATPPIHLMNCVFRA